MTALVQETPVSERQQIVVWSGGADSTMLLTERAYKATKTTPVVAISFDRHPQLNKYLLSSQRAAQKRYLAWAKKQNLPIKHVMLSVSSLTDLTLGDGASQALMWISHITPYLPKVCTVGFGYIKCDTFWHKRHEALSALRALGRVGYDCDWVIEYPYEWTDKHHILTSLKGWSVPEDCWWSCEQPTRTGVACGKCNKCKELRIAKLEQMSVLALELAAKKKGRKKS